MASSKRPYLPRGYTRPWFHRRGPNPRMGLFIPAHLSRYVPDDQVFRVELTEKGILFRPVSNAEIPGFEPEVKLPKWLQKKEREEEV